MKELTFIKPSQIGEVKIFLRIIRHLLYFKFNQSPMAKQAIEKFKSKGVKFREGNGWLEVDIFGDNKIIKLGEYEINLEEDNSEEIENKIARFYVVQYIKSGFKIDG